VLRWAVIVIVVIVAAALIWVTSAFGISTVRTKNTNLFGRQTSLAGVWGLVLASYVAACGMIAWAWRSIRPMLKSPPTTLRWRSILVRDCQPSDVRVHATVNSDAGLPPYVERDHDALLRIRFQEAARSAGFILVIGGSSTGKSRSLLAAM
jgi:hypothetical protein